MNYKEKCRAFRNLAYKANGLTYPPKARRAGDPRPNRQKWNSIEDLDAYFRGFGGGVKNDTKRRTGYLVVDMNEGMRPPQVIEVPMEFAMKVLALGGFP